jgi:hypothetical protein
VGVGMRGNVDRIDFSCTEIFHRPANGRDRKARRKFVCPFRITAPDGLRVCVGDSFQSFGETGCSAARSDDAPSNI